MQNLIIKVCIVFINFIEELEFLILNIVYKIFSLKINLYKILYTDMIILILNEYFVNYFKFIFKENISYSSN